MVAVVYCGGVNLNAALLKSGDAVLVPYYCRVSESQTRHGRAAHDGGL
jgi:endonuclease YncB( thermonuclease family)